MDDQNLESILHSFIPQKASDQTDSKRFWAQGYEQRKGSEPLRLLVMQPTSFCNLDCTYCYLPERHIRNRMSLETVDAVFTDLLTAPFLGEQLTVVWHAGEPLVAGLSFYLRAIESSKRLEIRRCHVTHSIQTNATLINDQWCEFFKQHRVRVGVSLDGPAFLHDENRKTRTGKGTHTQVMRGLECLRRYGVPFYVICVLTRKSLNYADDMFNFFESVGLDHLCFNIEETEGVHTHSSMVSDDVEKAFREFFVRFYELAERSKMRVREFEALRRLICSRHINRSNTQCLPFAILSVAADGSFSSFSPELLSTSHRNYGKFVFGNINRDPFISMLDSQTFHRVCKEIAAGVERCRESCEYFVLCRGGVPSNKVFENGTFDSSETAYCRLAKKALIDICLTKTESRLGLVEEKTIPLSSLHKEPDSL